MRRIENSEISYLQFDGLAEQSALRHGISLRRNGQINFSSRDPEGSRRNRETFCQVLGLPPQHLSRCRQVHSSRVAVVTQPAHLAPDTDALVTQVPGIPLMLLGADCPLLLAYDPVRVVLGLCHAGWRGTVQKIARRMIDVMTVQCGSRPEDLHAGIGPGICGRCYEVGPEVAEEAEKNLHQAHHYLHLRNSDSQPKWLFDLAAANRQQLLEAGLPPEQIETSGCCTFEQPDFPSYRREGPQTGRWALLAGII